MNTALPNNQDIEYGIIGAILCDYHDNSDDLHMVMSDIKAAHFYNPECRSIFEWAYNRFMTDGIQPDLTTAKQRFSTINVQSIMERAMMRFKIEAASNELKTLALRRSVIESATKLINTASANREATHNDIINDVNNEANRIAIEHSIRREIDTNGVIREAVQRVKDAVNSTGDGSRVFYHHPLLDTKLRHYRKQMHTMGAFQAGGKTALALECMKGQIKAGLRIGYLCTESSADELFLRIVANEMQVSIQSILDGFQAQKRQFDEFKKNIAYFKDRSGLFFIKGLNDWGRDGQEVFSVASRWARANGDLDMLYVDFLQDMQGPSKARGNEKEAENIKHNINQIHATADRLNCAVTVLSQFNREAHNIKQPTKASFRGSGSIDDKSHLMTVIWEPPGTNQKGARTLEMKYYSVKTRLIRPFQTSAWFTGETGRFELKQEANRYQTEDRPE